jgi:hypothetical protein
MTIKGRVYRLRSEWRYRVKWPAAYQVGLAKTRVRRLFGSKAETISFLIVSDSSTGTSAMQFDPLRRYAGLLRRRLGVVFYYMRLTDAMELTRAALSRFHAVGLKLDFRTPDPIRIVAHFRERTSEINAKLVYFDGDDDVCVQWPAVLRAVDLYVKKGVFASSQDYFSQFVGKSNLTHYVWKEYGVAPTGADVPASGVLEPADLDKLYLGWNIALDDKIVTLFRKIKPALSSAKDVDILCRASVPKDWISPLRSLVIQQLTPLKDRYRVLLPTHKVKQDQYNEEMRRGRICVSPLGYGEVCWRDFEAIICGCLLIKPDVSRLRSDPDIFVPGETYVPVRWDYADLPEKCAYYLERESERVRISENAYRVLANYYRNGAFVSSFAGLLERIGLLGSQTMASLAVASKASS